MRVSSPHIPSLFLTSTDFVDLRSRSICLLLEQRDPARKRAEKRLYTVLHKALSGTGKIGIAKVVISNRYFLAAVKPDGLFSILELMQFRQRVNIGAPRY